MTVEGPARTPRRWRGMNPAERDTQRRRRLLDAGLQAFGTHGYAATTIEALCAEAGVATRSFYELYGSKEALLRAVYDEIIGSIATAMSTTFADDQAPFPDALRTATTDYFEPLVGDERKGRITQLETVGVGDIEPHRREVISMFAGLISERLTRAMDDGEIPPQELGLLPLIMTGGISEALVDHLMRPAEERMSLSALIDEVARVWMVVLRVGESIQPKPTDSSHTTSYPVSAQPARDR